MSFAQTVRLEVISSDQGLSQGMIYDVLQDRTGFLWFGTRDGLNRYDGYTFQIFKNDPFNQFSISDNIVKCLFEDRIGRIWIGTETNGVDVFDPLLKKFYHLSKGENGLPSQNVNAFAEAPDGAIWVGTQGGLSLVRLPDVLPIATPDLNKVATTSHFFWEGKNDDLIRPNVVISLLSMDDGSLWVGTGRDAYRFDPATGQKELLPVNEPNDKSDVLKSNFFTKGPDGTVWLGQYNRIVQFKDGKTTFFQIPPAKNRYATYLTFDLEGNLYVSKRKDIYLIKNSELARVESSHLGLITPVTQVFCSFPEKDVIGSVKIFCDKRGLIWIATNGYGIRKYNPVNRLFRHCLAGVSTRKIRTNSKGEMWVWTSKGTFSLLDEQQDRIIKPIIDDKGLFHHDCLFAKNGDLWVLGEQRAGHDENAVLLRKHGQTGTTEQFSNLISVGMFSQIMEDRAGSIWILGSKSSLAKFDPVQKTSKIFDFSALTGFNEYAFALTEDANGHIWIGTPHGLIRGVPNPLNGTIDFSRFQNNASDPHSLNNNSILCIMDDDRNPKQNLWVGTRGGGLNLFDKVTGKCTHYSTADGLPNDVVYGILPDGNGCLWLSTNSGLSKFNPVSRFFENYSVADGLQDNEFNTVSYAQTNDGQMVFGGVNGLTIFDPKGINPINASPPVLITALKIQNKLAMPGDGILDRTIEQTKSVTLPYYQNHITLDFIAMDFSTPNKNQFRYRLVGAHEKWSEATTAHSTTFSNLPPGAYTFEVVTGGAHGLWNGDAATLKITILPPWWKSNLAYLLYFLLALGLAWQAYRFQVRRIQLQEQLAFEHRESERIRALEQMKNDFFSNITHELRTPVTLILEPLRQILRQPDDDNWRSKVQLAERNSVKLLQLVNQLLDLAKLEGGAMAPEYSRGQVGDLFVSIADSFAEKALSKGIVLRCSPKGPLVEPFDFDADKLGKIATNLLSNAIKFTPTGGSIDMTWHAAPGSWLILQVRDTGPGIASEDLPKVFNRFFSKGTTPGNDQPSTGIGLALCRELADVMGGQLEVESEPGAGATFRLWLPMLPVTVEGPSRALKGVKPQEVALAAPSDTTIPGGDRPLKKAGDMAAPLLLLAEDNHDLRQFISQTLSARYEVVEAVDGQDAVELARARIPDIIVSDLMMPRLDGLGLLDQVKNDIRTSHIPVLLLTAKLAVESRVKGLQHGADAYLGKPFQTEELFAWLENLLESRRRLQASYVQVTKSQGDIAKPSDLPTAGPSATKPELGLLDRQFLDQLKAIAEAELDNDRIAPEEIARRLAMSRSQLHRKLSAITGLSTTEYMRNFRLDRAHELLQAGAGNVSEIAFSVGFVNAKHFSTAFKERFGKSPSEV